jgi:signal transduction histidine kinase
MSRLGVVGAGSMGAQIAQQAALHGGKVSVDDGQLGGARFTVTLPR